VTKHLTQNKYIFNPYGKSTSSFIFQSNKTAASLINGHKKAQQMLGLLRLNVFAN